MTPRERAGFIREIRRGIVAALRDPGLADQLADEFAVWNGNGPTQATREQQRIARAEVRAALRRMRRWPP